MLCGILVSVFLSIYLLLVGLYRFIYLDRILVAERLDQLQKQEEDGRKLREELYKPLWERLGKPLWRKVAQVFARRMTVEKRTQFQRRLQAAGNPGGLGPGEFRLIQYLSTLCIGSTGIGFSWLLGLARMEAFFLISAGLILGYLFPEFYLNLRIKQRRREVVRSLPSVLDLLTVSVEAGLGFDIAMVKVTERFKGVLAEEFRRILHEIKMGKLRKEALKDMADRIEAGDLTSFVGALTQADQLGVSIGNILRLQADQMRRKRRQRAEEQAMQAPIKMLIPLVFFIFPALFVVLLGPAFIQIIRNF